MTGVEAARKRLNEAEQALARCVPASSSDPAVARLGARPLAQHHRNTDRDLQRYTKALAAVEAAQFAVYVAESRAREASRHRYTAEEVRGAQLVHDGFLWRRVVRVNAKSVTVETGYSWHDRVPLDKVHAVRLVPVGVWQEAGS